LNIKNFTFPEILRKVRSKNFLFAVLAVIYFFAVIELHLTISNFVTHPQNFLLFNIRPRNLALSSYPDRFYNSPVVSGISAGKGFS
jgi:hypothetical protein